MPKKSPIGLENIWDSETAEVWKTLNEKQQTFLLTWLSNGYNATQAYWDTYKDLANEKVASACGTRLLGNASIQRICTKMSNSRASELLEIKNTYKKAMAANKPVFKDGEMIMEIEDHQIRLNAAEKLAKLNGELTDKMEHSSDPDRPLFGGIERIIIKHEKPTSD